MKPDPFDVVKDWIAVALMAVLGTGAVFLLARGSWDIISREHSPTIQDPYERQSEAK